MDRSTALGRMTAALEAAKRARDRGQNVSDARQGLKAARAAYEAGDYQAAYVIADRIIQSVSGPAGDIAPGSSGVTTDASGKTTTVIEREVVVREVVKVPCRNCGTLLEITYNHCPNCGAPVR